MARRRAKSPKKAASEPKDPNRNIVRRKLKKAEREIVTAAVSAARRIYLSDEKRKLTADSIYRISRRLYLGCNNDLFLSKMGARAIIDEHFMNLFFVSLRKNRSRELAEIFRNYFLRPPEPEPKRLRLEDKVEEKAIAEGQLLRVIEEHSAGPRFRDNFQGELERVIRAIEETDEITRADFVRGDRSMIFLPNKKPDTNRPTSLADELDFYRIHSVTSELFTDRVNEYYYNFRQLLDRIKGHVR